MKFYKEKYLKTWTKEELINHILCLQHNLDAEERLNTHMYKIITAVMHKSPNFSKAVGEVLDIWNKSCGHRYVEVEK